MTQEQSTKSVTKMAEEEVNSFRAVDCTPLDADPLRWWKTHEHLYPHMAMLARRYLAVPGTSVPSESVLSTVGDIVTSSKSVLSTENVDILIFLKKR
ncbi:Zinc finger BED domain-containing protein 1 [Merluccius polli]|uniref:Zinc finger BED domain-containing protein 1 n=1 Tax=Merluccius polli TaxID=89951 RepID=A0AA47M0V1_MERPO|nr:Zinc finger BED domain-containing protein 1 [Merluccius polli]